MKILRDIWSFWVDTWNENKFLFWAEAIATLASVVASFLLATMTPDPPLLFIFSGYLLGSVLLQIAMYMRQSSWMMVLMTWYTGMNIIGLINAF